MVVSWYVWHQTKKWFLCLVVLHAAVFYNVTHVRTTQPTGHHFYSPYNQMDQFTHMQKDQVSNVNLFWFYKSMMLNEPLKS